MSELRTLKDLEKCNVQRRVYDEDDSSLNQASSEYYDEVETTSDKDLRAEAIKWLKGLKTTKIYPYGKDIPLIDASNKFSKFLDSEIFIKKFFNLVEEDLK